MLEAAAVEILLPPEITRRLRQLELGLQDLGAPLPDDHPVVASVLAAISDPATQKRLTPRRPNLLPQLMRAINDTTTAKVVDRLREKGLIDRRPQGGKAFVYRPRVAREEVENARARKAVSRLFGATPAPHAAVAALVEAVDAVDPKLLDELERLVIARRRPKDGT